MSHSEWGGDHTLAAFYYYDNAQHVWVSHDGRTWKQLAQPVTLTQYISDYWCVTLEASCAKTDGQHLIQIGGLNGTAEDPWAGGALLSTWTDGGLVALTQSGDQPPLDSGTDWAVGPTGIVVTHGGQLWIGLPSSN
jgi:hypothetical protein